MQNKKEGGGAQDKPGNSKNNAVIADVRFSSLHWDPRFQRVPKNQSKVPIDSRFKPIFTDKNFSSSSAPLDKRGKPKKAESQNHLLHYYHHQLDEDKEEEEEEEGPAKGHAHAKVKARSSSSSDSESSESDVLSDGDMDESQSGISFSSTSTDDDDSDDEDAVYSEEEVPSEKEDIPVIERETRRLAVVNMDWDYVKAVDLYVLLSSDLPKGGQVLSVAIYPSEFGLKRMEEEAVHGPTALFDDEKEHGNGDDDDDEIDNEKLRAYEKSRLRYYYAVVECESSATADHLYKIYDGVEFERTSNVLDLRFIPDSVEFKHPPRDAATEAPTNYEPLDYNTGALQHSKIHLSWDDDEPNRKKILKRKFKPDQLDELELKEFLASDDGETDDDENDDAEALPDNKSQKPNKRDLYRALIQSGDGSDAGDDGDKDMEVTFNTGLEDISKRILERKDKNSETVWEAYLRKRSEKKKERKKHSKLSSSEDDDSDYDKEVPQQPDDFFIEESLDANVKNGKKSNGKGSSKKSEGKTSKTEGKSLEDTEKEQVATREELELLLADDQRTDQSLKGYNLKSKKAKGKKSKEMPAEDKLPTFDFNDPRFSPLFTSHLFAMDPTDPQFKRSATYMRQLARKQDRGGEEPKEKEEMKPQRRAQLPSDDLSSKKQKRSESDDISLEKGKHELASLVRSVKRKVGNLQN